eukprot:m.185260 g.185260  ORF g.185260 m.185260 type:complete len:884 (-) comp32225_c0_seq1:569-3220(-)
MMSDTDEACVGTSIIDDGGKEECDKSYEGLSVADMANILVVRDQELQKLVLESAEKDALLTSMQQTLKENSEHVSELMKETRELASRTESTYKAQLEEKSKQLKIMHALLDDAQKPSSNPSEVLGKNGEPTAKLDRAFMDDFLISVLEQKDQLADKLYTLNNAYADIKAKLGMAEFEKEKLLAESRAANRRSGTTLSSSFTSEDSLTDDKGALVTESFEALQVERDRLDQQLAASNKTVQQLQQRLALSEKETSSRETERKRRKEAHRLGVPISKGNKLEELEKSNQKLQTQCETQTLQLKTAEDALNSVGSGDDQVKELQMHITTLERQLQDRAAEFENNAAELTMLRGLLGGGSTDRAEKIELETKLDELKRDNEEQTKTIDILNTQLREAVTAMTEQQQRLDDSVETVQQNQQHMSLIAKLKAELAEEKTESNTIIESQETAIEQLNEYKTMYEKLLPAYETLQTEAAVAKTTSATSVDEKMKALEDRDHVHSMFQREQEQRRKLHNRLVELAGNIRVFCKLRPMMAHDGETQGTEIVRVVDSMSVEAQVQGRWRDFEYDHVFAPDTQAAAVFDEVSPLVRSFMDGFNVCVLAYGQTGSGKTHTMLGATDKNGMPSMTGIIPCAMSQVFVLAEELKEQASFEFHVSVLEVYTEYVRDLISETPWEKHEVTEASGYSDVPTARKVVVTSTKQVLELVTMGMGARVERSTDLNEHSSRSHLIITAEAVRTSLMPDGTKTISRMHLVDLAGSENAKLAGTDARGLKEGKAINRSLSTLSNVLLNLGKQTSNSKQHVPYRNSKLTYLLKDAIGGNAKTLLIVCIPPGPKFATETVQSLRFATTTRSIEKGAATKNVLTPTLPRKVVPGARNRSSSSSGSSNDKS